MNSDLPLFLMYAYVLACCTQQRIEQFKTSSLKIYENLKHSILGRQFQAVKIIQHIKVCREQRRVMPSLLFSLEIFLGYSSNLPSQSILFCAWFGLRWSWLWLDIFLGIKSSPVIINKNIEINWKKDFWDNLEEPNW